MLSVSIGAQFEDAEGEWEVVGIEDDMVEVECIQEENINYGKRFMIPVLEAVIGVYGWERIVEPMDDEIREELHEKMSPCTDEEFLTAYIKAHKAKYGKDFEI